MLKHLRRRVVIALTVLVMSLGIAFIPTLFAQRVAQQDAPLKTLTLSGKVGTYRSSTPQARSNPRPLTRAQKFALFKGRQVATTNSFTLYPSKPLVPDTAKLRYRTVHVMELGQQIGEGHVWFPQDGQLELVFKARAGQLYALDYRVYGVHPGTFTLINSLNPGATQNTPIENISPVEGGQHITAYVEGENDGWLTIKLTCSNQWEFYSVEVTRL